MYNRCLKSRAKDAAKTETLENDEFLRAAILWPSLGLGQAVVEKDCDVPHLLLYILEYCYKY